MTTVMVRKIVNYGSLQTDQQQKFIAHLLLDEPYTKISV